jgi:hypothetical protein
MNATSNPTDTTHTDIRHAPRDRATRTILGEAMTRPLFRGLVLLAATLAISLVPTTPASADIANGPRVYDTVDAVQSGPSDRDITITGIIVGQSTATTMTYFLRGNSPTSTTEDVSARCDRFALLAMAKPGKYQFATVGTPGFFDCKLTVRAP